MAAGSSQKAVSTIGTAARALVSLLMLAAGANASTTLTFQDGVSGYTGTQNASIQGNYSSIIGPSTGFTLLYVYDQGNSNPLNVSHSLIKFDLSSITPDTVIGSAQLTLTYGYKGGGGGITNSLYVIDPVNVAWTDSTATWTDANNSGAGQAWAGAPGLLAGTDYNATAVATAASPAALGDTMTFTLTPAGVAAINGWISDPSSNAGFLIMQPSGSDSVDGFDNSAAATASLRPELTLVTTPEPASLGLLLVGGVMLLRRHGGCR